MPSSSNSNGITALSVCTSKSVSPGENLSPSFLSHLIIVPSVIVGDNAGIFICTGEAIFVVVQCVS